MESAHYAEVIPKGIFGNILFLLSVPVHFSYCLNVKLLALWMCWPESALAPSLCSTFNRCIVSGVFPDDWKCSKAGAHIGSCLRLSGYSFIQTRRTSRRTAQYWADIASTCTLATTRDKLKAQHFLCAKWDLVVFLPFHGMWCLSGQVCYPMLFNPLQPFFS